LHHDILFVKISYAKSLFTANLYIVFICDFLFFFLTIWKIMFAITEKFYMHDTSIKSMIAELELLMWPNR